MRLKKNIYLPGFSKAILISGLLFFPFRSGAQEEGVKNSIVADTTVTPASTDDGIEVDPGTSNQYFNNRRDTLSVQQRTIPPDAAKKMKEDEDFWYADSAIHSKKSEEEIAFEREHGKKGQKGKDEQAIKELEQQQQKSSYVPLGQRSWFQTFLWIVILAVFATALAIYLGGSNVGLFRKKNRGTTGEGEEEITEDIFAINYQKEIDKAAAQGNYRLAIRLLFLRLLKNMSEKNIIRYKQDKTNLDYLLELHPTGYYNNFFRLTRNYEYSWYGQFAVSEDAYQLIRGDFDRFDKELR